MRFSLAFLPMAVILIVSLSHCNDLPFKAGDCIQAHKDIERWEHNDYMIFKILEIGKKRIRYVVWRDEYDHNGFDGSAELDDLEIEHVKAVGFDKVPCPDDIEDPRRHR